MDYKEFLEEWENDSDFIKAKTSGSTGLPKEIKLPKDFVRESARRTNAFFKLDKESRFHSCISPEFIGGKMMAVRAQIAGAVLTWELPTNRPLENVKPGEKIDLLAVVPSQMLYILEHLENLPEIKNIIIGGSAIHKDLRKRIAYSGLNAYETYGMTETASHIALRKVTTEEVPFVLLDGIKIEKNSEGCLIIKFDNGYLVETNDIVEQVSEKEFFIKGRKDRVIISGGKKINPEDLERRVSDIINGEFFFTGVPDEKWGEKLVLVIEGPRDEILAKDLREKLALILSSFEMPKEIRFIEALPRTSNGKLIRRLPD